MSPLAMPFVMLVLLPASAVRQFGFGAQCLAEADLTVQVGKELLQEEKADEKDRLEAKQAAQAADSEAEKAEIATEAAEKELLEAKQAAEAAHLEAEQSEIATEAAENERLEAKQAAEAAHLEAEIAENAMEAAENERLEAEIAKNATEAADRERLGDACTTKHWFKDSCYVANSTQGGGFADCQKDSQCRLRKTKCSSNQRGNPCCYYKCIGKGPSQAEVKAQAEKAAEAARKAAEARVRAVKLKKQAACAKHTATMKDSCFVASAKSKQRELVKCKQDKCEIKQYNCSTNRRGTSCCHMKCMAR